MRVTLTLAIGSGLAIGALFCQWADPQLAQSQESKATAGAALGELKSIEASAAAFEMAFKMQASVPELTAAAWAARASASMRAARSARIIAWAAARSEGSDSASGIWKWNHIHRHVQGQSRQLVAVGRQVFCGMRQSIPSSR